MKLRVTGTNVSAPAPGEDLTSGFSWYMVSIVYGTVVIVALANPVKAASRIVVDTWLTHNMMAIIVVNTARPNRYVTLAP